MPTSMQDISIQVEFDAHGGWEVGLDDVRIACETLDDARRIALLKAAHRRHCELVVRDAYHRVIQRQHIDVAAGLPPR